MIMYEPTATYPPLWRTYETATPELIERHA